MIILTIVVFILILALLVLVHEFGHYIVAKKSGMQVEEFGFGFPPRLFGIKRGETIYSVNLIPLGGFVRILGENNEDQEHPRSFVNKGFWPRFFTLIAGVLMNFILAWILLSIVVVIGLPTAVGPGQQLPKGSVLHSEAITIVDVSQGSPAAEAGISTGDQILSVNGQAFNSLASFVNYIRSQTGKTLALQIKRGSQELNVSAYDRPNPPVDQGSLGVALAEVGRVSVPWYRAPVDGFLLTMQVIQNTYDGFVSIFTTKNGVSQLGGPVRIAALTNQVTKLGLVYIIQFAAILSVNLGILNIIPFPALDGGRVLFLLIEKIRGKRNNQKIEGLVNTIGFAVLLIFILLISIHDVHNLIHK